MQFDPKPILATLPDTPGVYRFYDQTNTIIYIGKAKNLKNRVNSYFVKSNQHNAKTTRLVSLIRKIEFSLVNTEFDALLLENSLIKQYQPKYNILLRDDKTFPFVNISNENFPKIYSTRQKNKDNNQYFGPYTNVKALNMVLELLHELFQIRTCNLHLTPQNIEAKKFKVCLEYHLGNCKGPCEGLQTEQDYNHEIEQAIQILKGNQNTPKQYFEKKMTEAASNLAFEEAQLFKNKLETLEKFHVRNAIVSTKIADVDVFALTSDDTQAYVHFMKIINGAIIQSETIEIKKKLNETDDDILTMIVWEMREQYQSKANEILTNIKLSVELGIENNVPQIGEKRKLIDLALKNVLYFKNEKLNKKIAEQSAGNKKLRVLITLKNDLQIKNIPRHIECFDNSNIQGTNPVSAMVCFKDGLPSKKEYRHYIPKTVIGPNDFATMHEVVSRRYSRLLSDNSPLPDLIIIDGGKGQLSAAVDALKNLNIYGQIPIIGIAKKLEEIYVPNDSIPLYIDKKSESLKLIQRLRDEAHRFGITHHRNRRSKNFLTSQIEQISGIGKATYQKLLEQLKTPKNIATSSHEQLAAIVGNDKAQKIINHFLNANIQ
jgi:excinuclease ABC subunit C